MKSNSRRKFLTHLGLSLGAVTLGKGIVKAMSDSFRQKIVPPRPTPLPAKVVKDVVDFRYAPPFWQSTYCFPDDPYKSLVGRNGELLYGHPGPGAAVDAFAQVVSIGMAGMEEGKYIEQRLEAPGIPIISTRLDWNDVVIHLTAFATNHEGDGRIDNLLIEIFSKHETGVECSPEIIIKSQQTFWLKEDERRGEIHFENQNGNLFLLANSPLKQNSMAQPWRFQFKQGTAMKDKPLQYVVRFPQEHQDADKVKKKLDDSDELLREVRIYWQSWKPTGGKVSWNLPDQYNNFYTASIRNMVESREVKNGKKVFQVGPTVYRGLWYIDGVSLLEAARYAGYDKEAQEGLETMWDRQELNGSFIAGAGESHWKDTPAAIYALCRQADLAQDWTYFNSRYPDAIKAVSYLRELRDKAKDDGTMNGKYNLLPRGFGDSGIDGIRSELTNTLWTLIGLKALLNTADRMFLERRDQVRELYGDLRREFFSVVSREELRKHPNGFSYLPMLMKDDPKWSESDVRKQPRPQVAQIYLSQAIYPGLIFPPEDGVVSGHVALMQAVTKEDIPIETGWLSDGGVWPYNAAILAQVYLWLGMPELARKTFFGFLNHASPLYAWREEQSLKSSSLAKYIGDMPHNWASAECVRYLRHMMILEDEEITEKPKGKLRLLDGVNMDDIILGKPMSLTYSPTKWGRVSVSLEPVDARTWQVKFKREDFLSASNPNLDTVTMPRHLPGNFQFDKIVGAQKFYKNGPQVFIDGSALEWMATFRNFEHK